MNKTDFKIIVKSWTIAGFEYQEMLLKKLRMSFPS